jgi:hypothetical protein
MANSDNKQNLWGRLGRFLDDESRASRFNRSFYRAVDAVGEAPLVGRLWKTPGEKLEGMEGISFGTEKGGYNEEGLIEYAGEGLRDIWEFAGRPGIKAEDFDIYASAGSRESTGHFIPRDWRAMHSRASGGKVDALSRLREYFGRDTIYAGKGFGGGPDPSTIVAELAHAVQWEDPKKWTKHDSRLDLYKEKLAEMARRRANPDYDERKDVHSDEGYTHEIVEPMLYEHLRKSGRFFEW